MPDTFDCALRTTPVQAGGETVVTGGRADAPMVEFTMAGAHLSEVQLALEQAQSCLLGETPEDMSPNEAWGDTVEKIRDALCNHIPSLCARLSPPPPDLARLRQRVEVLEGGGESGIGLCDARRCVDRE